MSFPHTTYNITEDFDWDGIPQEVWEMTAKLGIPYYCLEENTFVKTKRGNYKIKELKIGDELFDENGNICHLTKKQKTIHGEVIEIKTQEGQIIGSLNHKLLTDNGIKKMSEIGICDNLVCNTKSENVLVSIENIAKKQKETVCYDISVDSDSNLFTLSSGLISHNCNYMNSDMSADDAMSMCPLKGSAEILYLTDKDDVVKSSPIKEVYANMQKRNSEYVYLIGGDGNFIKSKINKFNMNANYKITLMNNDVVYTTYNHLNKTLNSLEVKTCDLTEDDYLPYSMNTINKNSEILSYDDGKIVDGFMWVKIKSIEKLTHVSTTAYCAEIVQENVEPIYMLSSGLITHNCRLRLDLSKLRSRGGGLFASNPNTGAIGVVTLNLPMIMLESKGNKEKFFEDVKKYCDIASESLEIKREVVEKLYGNTDEDTMYPFSKRVLQDCKNQNQEYGFNHFSVIGIVGSYEMCAEWDRFNGVEHDQPFKYTEEHRNLIVETIQTVLDKIPDIQERTGHLYNLEYTPCESASYTLGRKVQKAGGITSGTTDIPYLTNSTLPHSSFLSNLNSYLEDQNIFQPLATGGTVSHCFLGNRITAEKAKYMVKYLCENYKIPYFSLTPSFSICPTHGYISGQHFECPECGEKTLVYSRVVGFYKPIQQWNEGKVAEYNDRTFVDEEKI